MDDIGGYVKKPTQWIANNYTLLLKPFRWLRRNGAHWHAEVRNEQLGKGSSVRAGTATGNRCCTYTGHDIPTARLCFRRGFTSHWIRPY